MNVEWKTYGRKFGWSLKLQRGPRHVHDDAVPDGFRHPEGALEISVCRSNGPADERIENHVFAWARTADIRTARLVCLDEATGETLYERPIATRPFIWPARPSGNGTLRIPPKVVSWACSASPTVLWSGLGSTSAVLPTRR